MSSPKHLAACVEAQRRESTAQKKRAAMLRYWSDPARKALHTAAMNTAAASSAKSESLRRMWTDPAQRAARSVAAVAAHARRRAERLAVPIEYQRSDRRPFTAKPDSLVNCIVRPAAVPPIAPEEIEPKSRRAPLPNQDQAPASCGDLDELWL